MPDRTAPPDFAARLRQLRGKAGLTQQALAERAGVSIGTVRQLEQGRVADPGLSILRRLATALSVTLDAFG